MSNPPYVFIHPMLGPDDAWSAFKTELPVGASSPALLARLVHAPELAEFDHRLPWFFPADSHTDTLQVLGERAVIVFNAETSPESADAQKHLEEQLRQALISV